MYGPSFWAFLLVACALAAFASWTLTGVVRRALVSWRLYDTPNARSSHTSPKPRGGGLALIPVIVAVWAGAAGWLGAAPAGFANVMAGAGALAVVSWIDDVRGLPAAARLVAQAVAVAFGLMGLEAQGAFLGGFLPPVADRIVAGVLWLWFLNLFNFMDGIDGISGVEAISLGTGLGLVGALAAWPAAGVALPVLLAAAALGFLVWNWAPAKLFLGDVGSVPLGYLLGWLLVLGSLQGQWAAALILPLYYLADASITLARRAARGAPVWHAHREHFYQRAVQGGASHARVCLFVLACNVVLIACAAGAARGHAWPALGIAGSAVGLLLVVLWRLGAKARGNGA